MFPLLQTHREPKSCGDKLCNSIILSGLRNVAFPYLFVAQLSLVSPPVFTSADQTVVAT